MQIKEYKLIFSTNSCNLYESKTGGEGTTLKEYIWPWVTKQAHGWCTPGIKPVRNTGMHFEVLFARTECTFTCVRGADWYGFLSFGSPCCSQEFLRSQKLFWGHLGGGGCQWNSERKETWLHGSSSPLTAYKMLLSHVIIVKVL